MPYLHSLRCQEVLCYAVCWTQSEELNAKLNFDVSPPEQTGQIKQTKMCCDHVKPLGLPRRGRFAALQG